MTTGNPLIPAAQYLRMSTEHQQYSLQNQSTAIQKYAEARGLQIVRTYSDVAKSGLVLRHRPGLQQLLRDVVGTPAYRAILVYDVSRWGRFQDTDESAHYEFLCKSAGVPVHYCAETFSNDGTFPSLIMKTLKRTMAAEFSRELGVKVLEGQKRLAGLGFKISATGGTARYLNSEGVKAQRVNKVSEGRPHVVDLIKNGDIQLVFNTTEGAQALSDSRSLRRAALLHKVPYYTTLAGAIAASQGIRAYLAGDLEVRALQDYFV